MWRFKSCPKCNGDMLVGRDHDGWYEWCLQCGHRHDLIDIIKARPHAKVAKKVVENV